MHHFEDALGFGSFRIAGCPQKMRTSKADKDNASQAGKPLTGLEIFQRDMALRLRREQAEKLEKRCTANPSYTLGEVCPSSLTTSLQ